MGRTQVELFRSGNATTARLHKPKLPGVHSRPEIETFIDQATGDVWVKANTGGPSTDEAIDPDWLGPPYRLQAGADIPDELILTPDGPGHWLWEPSRDMRWLITKMLWRRSMAISKRSKEAVAW